MQCLNLEDQQVYQANRMLKDDQVYHSLAYKRKGNSCSYIVQFREGVNDEFGLVRYYLFVRNTNFKRKSNICSFELEDQDDMMVKSFIEQVFHHLLWTNIYINLGFIKMCFIEFQRLQYVWATCTDFGFGRPFLWCTLSLPGIRPKFMQGSTSEVWKCVHSTLHLCFP